MKNVLLATSLVLGMMAGMAGAETVRVCTKDAATRELQIEGILETEKLDDTRWSKLTQELVTIREGCTKETLLQTMPADATVFGTLTYNRGEHDARLLATYILFQNETVAVFPNN